MNAHRTFPKRADCQQPSIARAFPRLRNFARETEGNMSLLAIAGATMMMVFGGVGIDMIQAEVQRTKLQNTLDRAVLAAANLNQTLDPVAVVDEYFNAAGLGGTLSGVTVDSGLSYRTVTATAQNAVKSNFLGLLGVPSLHSAGLATADERIANVEISMVLDVSGSMGWNNKIGNLRTAATEFVNTVVQQSDSGLTTINIVPYNATVNVGPTLANYYALTNEHTYSNCAIFDDADFLTTAIDPAQPLQRLAHFDPWSSSTSSTQINSPWCKTGSTSSIIAQSADKTALNTYIASLTAGGNTAIDLGMKWGVALLDPAARPVVTDMIADGHVIPEAAGRPADYTADDAIKIVVLMTDGENTTQYDLKPQYKTGLSEIFIDDRGDSDPSNDRFSRRIRDNAGTSNDVYFWTRYEYSSWGYRYRNTPDGGANARQMTNAEVFARWGTRAFARKFFYRPYYDRWDSYSTYYNAYYAYTPIVNNDSADARLSNICAAARDENVTIFAIGFEAPARGLAAMRDCASSPAHYFSVQGLEIADAFKQIARTINQLRLTQ